MKVKNACICIYCGKELPGFVECNCESKFKNKGLWRTKKIGHKSKSQMMKVWK